MMRFASPEFLWLLLLLPLAAWLAGRRGLAGAVLFSTTAELAALARHRRARPLALRLLPRLLALLFLLLALARPQLGQDRVEVQASGIDILLAVDVSGSMEALDFQLDGKTVNRLEAVKEVVNRFIDQRPNDRIGLLAFGGRPYMVSPLTLDHSWLQRRLEALNTSMVEEGTAIGSALGSGTNRLRGQQSKSRIIILLTDGMNNSGKIPPLMAAEAAASFAIKVYTIGAGTRGEAPFPVTDQFGRKRIVRVAVDIDEETLTKVAELTGAKYYRAIDSDSLARIYQEIDQLETTTRTIKRFESSQELFIWLLLAAVAALTAEIAMNRRRIP